MITKHDNAPQAALISRLNPIIKGWVNYHKHNVSSQTFNYCDHMLFVKLFKWAKRRSKKESVKECLKYWRQSERKRQEFRTHDGKTLTTHADTLIVRHAKVRDIKSPYDGDSIYWGQRLQKYSDLTTRQQNLLKRQKGKCAYCSGQFNHWDILEVDHTLPRVLGGKDIYSNLQLLHRHCHDVKTAHDGSQVNHAKRSEIRLEGGDSSTPATEKVAVNQIDGEDLDANPF
ncbi:MAG: reverse transcriptase [Symploca sp. SIO1C4]|uniref:Reverse transcriptase n=1 Tax=Symploca sp. SIO1C4 TaxID=2607765 RepID=A0A6B3N027_9CYAN|nr:reverse transcriptase [Symploca sp. SIO1C4]